MSSLFSDLEADNSTEPLKDEAPKPFTQDETEYDAPQVNRRNTKMKKDLEGLYTAAALAVFPFDQQIGSLIAENAENCAVAWEDLAKQNSKVKRILESLLQTSAYGTLIAAHMPIAVALATKYVPALRQSYEAAFDNGENAT